MTKAKSIRRATSASRGRTASNRKSAPKSAPTTVEQYFVRAPEPARSALNQIRAAIRAEVPAESTEIISYGIPAFKHKRVLLWYAAFSDHCSLFPTAAVIQQLKDELRGFSTSKGTVHFPFDKPMPLALIKKIVRARVKQDNARTWLKRTASPSRPLRRAKTFGAKSPHHNLSS